MDHVFEVYKGKTVLVTGHTGFKGSWLVAWLNLIGADVIGFSDDLPTIPSHFEEGNFYDDVNDLRGDVSDLNALMDIIHEYKPDFVFHLAAEAIVNRAYENPHNAFQVNVMGTVNCLEALRRVTHPTTAVFITSDKVYDNVEWVWGYRENDVIGGKDPYSASKGMAELAIRSYFSSYFNQPNCPVKLGIGRAGNVIGGGDWAPFRLVPDCVKSWAKQEEVTIRNPNSTRPWQHVLEPLSGYLLLGQALHDCSVDSGEAFNFGPPSCNDYSVNDLIESMQKYWDKVSCTKHASKQSEHKEAGLLKLNCDKAQALLKWQPCLTYEETVQFTMRWYKSFYEGDDVDVRDLSRAQIREYIEIANQNGLAWVR